MDFLFGFFVQTFIHYIHVYPFIIVFLKQTIFMSSLFYIYFCHHLCPSPALQKVNFLFSVCAHLKLGGSAFIVVSFFLFTHACFTISLNLLSHHMTCRNVWVLAQDKARVLLDLHLGK